MNFFENIPNEILENEIIGQNLDNEYQLKLLCHINKKFFKNVQKWNNKKKREKKENQTNEFFVFVQNFITRKDFSSLNFIFHPVSSYCFFEICIDLNLFELMKYFNGKNGKQIITRTINNNIRIKKFCTWSNNTRLFAIEKNKLKFLEYLDKNDCSPGYLDCYIASKYGHLECLKYLHKNGCECDKECYLKAIENDHFQIVKYLFENKCPYDKEECLEVAKNKEIKDYIENFM